MSIRRFSLGIILIILAGFFIGTYLVHSRIGGAKTEFSMRTESVKLPPHIMLPGQAHYDHAVWSQGTFVVPEDMWVTAFSAEISGAPPDKLHNFYLYKQNTADGICKNNPQAIWAGGTVSREHPTEYPEPYGVLLHKGDTLLLRAMLTNERDAKNTEYDAVSLTLHGTFEPAAHTTRTKNVQLELIGPHVCDTAYPIFPLPPYSKNAVYSSKKTPFIIPADAQIVRVRGHYHGSYEVGLVNTLRLYLNGHKIDEVSSSDISDGQARNPLMIANKIPLAVMKGDKMWMEAVFSNPSDQVVPEGMALVGIFYTTQ